MVELTNILDVPKHVAGLEVVVFDMDDTLYSEKEYVRSGYAAIAKFFPQIHDAENKLWSLFEAGVPAIDVFLKNEGLYSDEMKQQCLYAYRFHQPKIHLYPGVHEMLCSLKERYRLGLITDGRPEGQRAKIQALQIEKLFDNIIVTDELGGIECRKPNTLAFQKMQEFFGTEYTQMCYVGDNLGKDFLAPQELGMTAIYFKNADGMYRE